MYHKVVTMKAQSQKQQEDKAMQIYREKDYEQVSFRAANIVAAQMILKPDCVLGLATGSTPEGMYSELVKKYERGEIDFSKVRTANLDEYIGVNSSNDQSYYYYMHKHLFGNVNIDVKNTNIPNGMEKDDKFECARYERVIGELGGVDIQVLGMGLNGHIGFNEPANCFERYTHCVALTQSTIDANARFFEKLEDVPKSAYTMGIGTIMRARKLMLLVCGKAKAAVLKAALYGPITPEVPASVLQLHNDVIVIADEEALSLI